MEPRAASSQAVTVVAIDIETRARPSDSAWATVRDAVRSAATSAGLGGDDVEVLDRGDGALLLVPATHPTAVVAGRFLRALDLELARHNQDSTPETAIRLRVALDGGPVATTADGPAGSAVTHARRLLQAPVLRSVLAAASQAHLAVIVSDVAYDEAIGGRYRSLDPSSFARVEVRERAAGTAWVQVPGLVRPPGLEADDGAPRDHGRAPDARRPRHDQGVVGEAAPGIGPPGPGFPIDDD